MSIYGASGSDSFDLKTINELDEICDQFESSWKNGTRPQISSFLSTANERSRLELFLELVRVDAAYRKKSGDDASAEFYSKEFPEYSEAIRSAGLDTSIAAEDATQLLDSHVQVEPSVQPAPAIKGLSIKERVGAGSFGAVWRAFDRRIEREVAVKVPIRGDMDARTSNSFSHEARSAAKLRHPSIVRIYSIGPTNGVDYIVSEFVDGMNMRTWISKRDPSPEKAASVCSRIASGLAHAHGEGVVHRDIKPANILIDENDNPYITDFGLAKHLFTDFSITEQGGIVGTPAYMSPEQARGDSDEVDEQSDVYSLGAILYEVLAGRKMFTGRQEELIAKIVNKEPTKIRELNSDVPEELESVCLKSTAKEKSDRYASAADFEADLNRFLAGEPVHAKPISRVERSVRWARRNPAIATSYAVASFMMFAALAMFAWFQFGDYSSGAAPVVETWNVKISTEPSGAQISLIPFKPNSSEPDFTRMVNVPEKSPAFVKLKPGNYTVIAKLGDRMQKVERFVPELDASMPLGSSPNRSYKVVGDQLEWPGIKIPENSVSKDMRLIKGGEHVIENGDRKGEKVIVPSFYVATKLFTYEDYFELFPGGSPFPKIEPNTPHSNPMTTSFDYAMGCAEKFGGRLMTEVEYEYLTHQIGSNEANDSESDREIVMQLPEWTTTAPANPITPDPGEVEFVEQLQYRIVCGKEQTGREQLDVNHRTTVFRSETTPAFRICRTVSSSAKDGAAR